MVVRFASGFHGKPVTSPLTAQGICSYFVLMPEPYHYKRRGSYTLSDCHRNGHLIHVRCNFCKLSRYYVPDDLRKVFNDIEVDDVVYQMRCERGGRDHHLTLSAELISADKRQGLMIRRLDKIVYDRRVIWRDERG